MSEPIFPSRLPNPTQSYSSTMRTGLRRVTFEGGFSRIRREFDTLPTTHELTWEVNDTQFQELTYFLNFYAGKSFRVDLIDPSGTNLTRVSAKLISDLNHNFVSDGFQRVSGTFEVLKVTPAEPVYDPIYLLDEVGDKLLLEDGNDGTGGSIELEVNNNYF